MVLPATAIVATVAAAPSARTIAAATFTFAIVSAVRVASAISAAAPLKEPPATCDSMACCAADSGALAVSSVVATARAGVYPLDRLDKVPVQRRERFFKPAVGDAASVVPDVARLVTFKQLNLIEHWPLRGPFDAIFCRNVVIYFDKETQRTLFERFARLQGAGTHLYIGHSETLFRICDRYELIGKSTWRRLP